MTFHSQLMPCRACGSLCRVERFEGGPIEGVMSVYFCSNSTKFGGDCPDHHVYLSINAWNARTDDDRLERLTEALEGSILAAQDWLLDDPKAIAAIPSRKARLELLHPLRLSIQSSFRLRKIRAALEAA